MCACDEHYTKCCVLQLELQGQEVVVYDQSSPDSASLSSEAFLSILLAKLEKRFPSVHLLSGLDNDVNCERKQEVNVGNECSLESVSSCFVSVDMKEKQKCNFFLSVFV